MKSSKKKKKLPYTEREMITYLYEENKTLKREIRKLKKERLDLLSKISRFKTLSNPEYYSWDVPAIGAPHGW